MTSVSLGSVDSERFILGGVRAENYCVCGSDCSISGGLCAHECVCSSYYWLVEEGFDCIGE